MFRTDPLFSISVLVTAVVHFAITKALSGRVRRLSLTVTDREGDIGARLHETFVGIRAIKSFAAERFDSARLAETAEAYRRRFRRAHFVAQVDTPIRLVADAIAAAVVLALTFYWVAQERLTLQAAALFFYLSQQLLAPISQIFRQWLAVSQLAGEATRVVEIFQTQSEMPDGAHAAEPLRDRIVLERVSFAFEPGRPVLSGIDLDIEHGQTVALVGPSGAGKTTLADLILRLYDVTAGAIRYDGRDVRELQQRSFRRHFGVVAQESLIFNATARENIVFNRPEDPDALAHAIWAANAEGFLRDLPQGLDTLLGDRGVRLSGGQRQRIAIARAIYARPSVLILDEATSALDSESEREVQQAIDRIGREMTLVVIAHRLSTIVHADKVVVLNQGRIEAEGRHEQVLSVSPTYRRLYDLQMSTSVG
jgi:subfamily B ATP-binding cassette protein MsbA